MICRICCHDGLEPLAVKSFLLPGNSYAPNLNKYENYICPGCGVVSGQPEPSDEALSEHYNSAYRVSRDALMIGDKLIDTPIDFTVGGRSLARVRNFYDTVNANTGKQPDVTPHSDDLVIDIGAYQGMFLHGVSELWGCRCLATDYSREGIRFARDFLGFCASKVTEDIYTDTFDEKARFVTMIHSLEHLREPVRFLNHLKDNVLVGDGYLYIEVPNLYGIALCEPAHFFTYTEDSLTSLLQRCGFDVLDMWTSGHPIIREFTAHNDEQNLICLARPGNNATLKPLTIDVDNVRHRLRREYTLHSVAAIGRQMRSAATESARFIYYLVFAGLLERISPRLTLWLAGKLGRR